MFKAIRGAMVEWGMAWRDPLLQAIAAEAPEGKTRQLEMFGSKDAGTTLKASLKARVRGRDEYVRIEITSSVSYAIIIRDGRGIVVPKAARVLHWVDENGQDVFAMSSGPVDPNPYPRRGYERVREALQRDLGQRMAKAATKELLATAKAGGMKVLL